MQTSEKRNAVIDMMDSELSTKRSKLASKLAKNAEANANISGNPFSRLFHMFDHEEEVILVAPDAVEKGLCKLRQIESKCRRANKKYKDSASHLLTEQFLGIDKKVIDSVEWKASGEIVYNPPALPNLTSQEYKDMQEMDIYKRWELFHEISPNSVMQGKFGI